jgi:hypothetical protein
VEPREGYQPPKATDPAKVAAVGANESLVFPAGALLCVRSAFRPAPLLEALHKAGHRTYVAKAAPNVLHTYVCPKASA